MRILIVDDHEATRTGLRLLLSSHTDWLVCGEAVDGLEAVQKAKELRPDVVLMDVSMPRMGGVEATRIIRRELPESAVIFLSQNDPDIVRRQAAEVDVHAYVAKDRSSEDLLVTIDKVLADRRRAAADVGTGDAPASATTKWLAAGGEMGERIGRKNWAETLIGSVETWSPALRMMVSFLLTNRFPLLLWWGPEYVSIYNDAYIPVLGKKHPKALGQPVSECWDEIWHILKPLIDTPYLGGPATWSEDLELQIKRSQFIEETHFTVAYSAVPDETAPRGVGGVLATVHEITDKIVGERRLAILRDLGSRATEGRNADEASSVAAETLGQYPKDVPFALIYLIDADQQHAHLAAASGVAKGDLGAPLVLDLGRESEGHSNWPTWEALRNEESVIVTNLDARFAAVPAGPWTDPPHTGIVVPIRSNKAHEFAGLLICGVSSRLKFDQPYRSFFDLTATQIATAIANARAYEEERKRAEALAEIDRAKTVFFNNVSHEFRTPLTLMLGPIEDLLASSQISADINHQKQLEVIHRNGLRLLKLVNTLLDFSRIEAGRAQVNLVETDLAAFTSELASVFRSAMEKAGLKFTVECPSLREPVSIDRDMWEKIVFNLLSNAFKFTLSGEVTVSLCAEVDGAVLNVRDSGIGIPAQELPNIFKRFHRIENMRGRTHEGSGIGLALTQELVKLHGGRTDVESQLGVGTVFHVYIPFRQNQPYSTHTNQSTRQVSTALHGQAFVDEALMWLPDEVRELAWAKHTETARFISNNAACPRILVAEDNADMRDYIRHLLQPTYELHTVSNGAAALEAANNNPPDLILSDVMMPKMDGLELVRRLRADERLTSVPVILLSARAGEEARIEGVTQGADDYLTKPFSARELLARVQSHLELARVRKQGEERFRTLADSLETQVRLRTEELERQKQEVLNQAKQLRDLSARLMQTQDKERRHIARELHDSVGQTLAALGMNVASLTRQAKQHAPQLTGLLEDSEQLAQALQNEIRTMSYLLHPPLLDESGLGPALRHYVEGLMQRSELNIKLSIAEDLGRLSTEVELVVFRIVQECLTNIHRHSGSKTALIRIASEGDCLSLEIEDRGKGMSAERLADIQSQGSGVGIRGMRERVHQFQGEFDIKSNGTGTRIAVRLPIATTKSSTEHAADVSLNAAV